MSGENGSVQIIDRVLTVFAGEVWLTYEEAFAQLVEFGITRRQLSHCIGCIQFRNDRGYMVSRKEDGGRRLVRLYKGSAEELADSQPNPGRKRKHRKKTPLVYPDYLEAIPEPTEPPMPKNHSSVINVSDEEREWLESIPLRKKVVKHWFDLDAIIYRRLETMIRQFGPVLKGITSVRSQSGSRGSAFYWMCYQVSKMPSIDQWTFCSRCNGTGIDRDICPTCKGRGYNVPSV